MGGGRGGVGEGFKEPWLSASKSALRSLGNFTIRRPRLRLGFYYHQQSSLFCHLRKRWSFDPGLCLHPHSVFVALITSSNARVGRRKVEKTEKNPHNSVGSLLLLPSWRRISPEWFYIRRLSCWAVQDVQKHWISGSASKFHSENSQHSYWPAADWPVKSNSHPFSFFVSPWFVMSIGRHVFH